MAEVVNVRQNYSPSVTSIFQNCMLPRHKTLKLFVYIMPDSISTKLSGHSQAFLIKKMSKFQQEVALKCSQRTLLQSEIHKKSSHPLN